MVDQRPVLLEPRIAREELDMLLWQNSTNQSTKVSAAIEFLGPSEQDVGSCGRVGDDDPGCGEGSDEGLDDGGLVAGGERGEPGLERFG